MRDFEGPGSAIVVVARRERPQRDLVALFTSQTASMPCLSHAPIWKPSTVAVVLARIIKTCRCISFIPSAISSGSMSHEPGAH